MYYVLLLFWSRVHRPCLDDKTSAKRAFTHQMLLWLMGVRMCSSFQPARPDCTRRALLFGSSSHYFFSHGEDTPAKVGCGCWGRVALFGFISWRERDPHVDQLLRSAVQRQHSGGSVSRRFANGLVPKMAGKGLRASRVGLAPLPTGVRGPAGLGGAA